MKNADDLIKVDSVYVLKQDIIVKVNTKIPVFMFKFENTDYNLQYIVTTKVK